MLDYVVPLLVTLIFDALVIFLFRSGMSKGSQDQNQDTSFSFQIARGWTRGWLFVILLMIPWFVILAMAFMASDYVGKPEIAYLMFYGGILVVFLYPGIDIFKRVRLVYPSLAWKPATKIALGWTVPLSIFWSFGFWVIYTRGHHFQSSTGFQIGLGALFITISLVISRALGIRGMSNQLKGMRIL